MTNPHDPARSFEEQFWVDPIVFAPVGSLYLLGATALEIFGVQADPTTQQLKPIAALIGGFLGSASTSKS